MRLIIGGEALSTSLVNRVLDQKNNIAIFNEYGPTEATVGCMVHLFNPQQDKESWVPIGKPIANCDLLLQATESSTSTYELYIAGDVLALEYLGKAAQAQKSFLAHPDKAQKRIYRSGDFVSLNSRGVLIYQGRKDEQLKIRGFRVELGEIEGCIYASQLIRACTVMLSEENKGRLLAFVVWRDKVVPHELSTFLKAQLPTYMIPEHIIPMSNLPLTVNGKVDKQALTHYCMDFVMESSSSSLMESPCLQELSAMLGEVLGDSSMTLDKEHSLLAQGVDSLAMTIFLTRILNRYFDDATNFEFFFSTSDFMQNPTLALLERMITKDKG